MWLWVIGCLYSLFEILSAIGYLSQIHAAFKADPDKRNLSLYSWTIWTGNAVVGFAYLYAEKKLDVLLVIIFLTNGIGSFILFVLALDEKWKKLRGTH